MAGEPVTIGRVDAPVPADVLVALRAAAAAGTRIAPICVGAFTLAEAGLLDGRPATTHWAAADALARRHPRVQVDPRVLYVDNGQVLTSAGASAGLDLCLHMIRRDHGTADASRLAVAPSTGTGARPSSSCTTRRRWPSRRSNRSWPGSRRTPTATSPSPTWPLPPG